MSDVVAFIVVAVPTPIYNLLRVLIPTPLMALIPYTFNMYSLAMVVPMPTFPRGFTIKLSVSTCRPSRKLNDLRIFAIIVWFFSYLVFVLMYSPSH